MADLAASPDMSWTLCTRPMTGASLTIYSTHVAPAFWLLGAVALLVIFGITMIRSAVAGNIELEELNLVGRQLVFAAAGFVVILIVSAIDYRLWSSISRLLYIGTFLVLAVLYVVGAAVFGSARWFDTGVILIQPSELAKVVMILVLADFFARNHNQLDNLFTVFRSFLLTMGIVIWILLQPNLSTSIVMVVLWFALLWASGLRLKHLALFIGAAILAPVASFPFLVDYQQRRIINFLFPDPNARHGEIYNIQQALISIGSGGLLGQGYGQGAQVQLRFLKVRHSDFIFSALSQEFGFVGALFVLGLFPTPNLLYFCPGVSCQMLSSRASRSPSRLLSYPPAAGCGSSANLGTAFRRR